AGDPLPVRAGSATRDAVVIGTLAGEDERSRRAIDNLLIADIAAAQELLGSAGRLTRIDVRAPEGATAEPFLARLRTALPPQLQLVPAASRAGAIEQMTAAFRLNLTALSLLALVVGMFLIYNTMTFSVVQRRTLIGTLRAIGVTRPQVFGVVLVEAAVIGAIGTMLGLALGIVLGRGLVGLVTRTINDLYFVVTVRALTIDPLSLIKGGVLGMGATLLAAVAPAWEATTAPPRTVMSRAAIEANVRRAVPRTAALGGALLALAAALLAIPSRDLVLGFVALFLVMIGGALLAPGVTVALMAVLRPIAGRAFGWMGRMAVRGVVATLSRTAVAIAALMMAIAVTVGVGVMVGSFRHTVMRWLESALQADIYISPPSLVSRQSEGSLDPALIARLALVSGVADTTVLRSTFVPSSVGTVHVLAVDLADRRYRPVTLKEGAPDALDRFRAGGAVLISEPFAYRHGLRPGDVLRFRAKAGERRWRVVGVYYDYGSEQGAVMMPRRDYVDAWGDSAISSMAVFVEDGKDVDAVIASLRAATGPGQEVFLRSNRALRALSLEIFDRTFVITGVLQILATIVAFVGVLSALMALQLERAREVGVLRATGVTPRQVWGLVTTQTGLMGLAAGLLSIPVGLALSLVLILVVNRRSFGWTLQIALPPPVLLHALLLAVAAAILAGAYPALRMARTSPAAALRDE
ncbi:MAG: ABC transporter permease, partial [Armatimonadetes bacterium]|nr:ABC transporter permease [Armatimonadota bacterium]